MIVVLTFDDGLLKHYEVAKMLYKIDIQATFYIITGLTTYNSKPLLMRNVNLVREMHDMQHEIASHSHTHRDLTKLSSREVEAELFISKSILEDIIDCQIYGFAYPYGSYNKNVIESVRKYFKYARSMGPGNRWNESIYRYAIGSVGIRHLLRGILKLLSKKTKLLVLTFHDEPPLVVLSIARLLKNFSFRMMTLYEALRKLQIV